MGLMKITILIILVTALSSCQSTRTETFQGQPIKLKPGEELVHHPVKDDSREMMNLMFDVLF